MIRKTENTSIAIIIAILIGAFPLFGQSLTLDQAIEMAIQNNEKVQQYREKLNQAKYADREAWGNFLPSVKLQASYNRLNDPLIIDLNPIRRAMITLQANNQVEFANVYSLLQGNGALTPEQRAILYSQYAAGLDAIIPPFTATLKNKEYNMATVVGAQPLFMGGKLIAAKKAASAEKHSSESELTKIKNEIARETINNYLAVVLLNQVVRTREDVLACMQKHQADAKRLFEEGLIARYDLLRAEVAVAEADRNLFDDRNRLALAKVALCHSIGLADDSLIELSDSLKYFPVEGMLEFYKQQAKQNQPILKMISFKKRVADQKVAAERSEFLPQLVGFGKYEFNDKDLSALEPKWVVGVQLNFSIFNGFKDYNRLRSAMALRDEVKYIEIGAQRQIDLWLNKSYRDMRNAETRYAKLEASVNLADESVRLNEKRFSSGLGTSLEVIDANLSLEKNKIERITSLYDYYRSLADLLTAAGRPQDLLVIWDNKE